RKTNLVAVSPTSLAPRKKIAIDFKNWDFVPSPKSFTALPVGAKSWDKTHAVQSRVDPKV
ncbi:hypothetical protein, partial [Rhodopirellula baltica]|uniref:hypothetical protein n=1 Tax=Rhodopirellula baltica TaxID=265606 RepID=UPI0023F44C58